MKIKPYVTKLNSSKEYKSFAKKHDDAFMIAGFFILDFESGKHVHQIDYYVPSEKKVAAFTLDRGVTVQMMDMIAGLKAPEQLDLKTNVDLDALHGILEDEMKNRGVTDDIKKIIAIVQCIDGKKIWNLNCVLSGMGILKAHVDDDSRTVLKMEKASLFDYIKKMSPADMEALKQGKMPGQQTQNEQAPQAQPIQKDAKKLAEEKIKKLNQLEEEIEKEKAALSKQLPQESKEAKPEPSKVSKAKTKKKN